MNPAPGEEKMKSEQEEELSPALISFYYTLEALLRTLNDFILKRSV